MSGLFKRPRSPFWYYRFRFGGRDYWGSTKTTAKLAAERIRAERIAQILHGRQPDGKTRLGALAEDYLRWFEAQGVQAKWTRTRRVWIGKAVEHLGENTPVRLITTDDVEGLKGMLIRTPSYRGSALTSRTVRGYLGAVRQMFDFAVRRGYLGRSPAREVALPPQPRPNPKFLTLEQLSALLDAAPSPWWRALLTVAAFTGMRRGELCRMRWSDIDRGRGRIRIRQTKTGQTIEVPIHPEAGAALSTLTRSTRSDRVFFDPETDPEDYDRAWENRATHIVPTIFARAGLPGTLHALRHTYATLLLAASGNLKVVQEALGHRHITTTMQYAFLLREGLEDAVRRLPGLSAATSTKTATPAR